MRTPTCIYALRSVGFFSNIMHVVTTHVAYFKKTMMHLRNHCAYVHFTTVAGAKHEREQPALLLHGNSAIDHLHLRATFPQTFFDTFDEDATHDALGARGALEVNLYLLYDIIRRATSFRCQRIRLRWDTAPPSDKRAPPLLHISFETGNKRDVYQLACRYVRPSSITTTTTTSLPTLPTLPALPVCPPSATERCGVRVDAALLHNALLRFDEDTFTTVTLSLRNHALVLKGKTDAMRGRVKLPATTASSSASSSSRSPHTPVRHKCGTFALADLLLTTRFGLLSADKVVHIAPVQDATSSGASMLHVHLDLWANACVDVLFPTVVTSPWTHTDSGGESASP